MIVGITGLIGSGKSKVGILLQSLGLNVVDCDSIAAELYGDHDIVKRVEKIAGRCRDKKFNIFDKKILFKFLYNHPDKIRSINRIMHPIIIKRVNKLIQRMRAVNQHLVVMAPLLFECNMQNEFDVIVYVYSDYEIRKHRLMTNRKFECEDHIRFFDGFQISAEKKFSLCDYVILNNTDSEIDNSVEALFKKIF